MEIISGTLQYPQGKSLEGPKGWETRGGDSATRQQVRAFIPRGGKYFEDDAKIVSIETLNVVAFCHLQGMVHRDWKPEFFNNSSLQTGEDHPNFVRIMYLVVYLSISRHGNSCESCCCVRGGKYFEDDAKVVSIEILNVVAFCHLQGMVHCDLKPEHGNSCGPESCCCVRLEQGLKLIP
ncbi:hypothetical protein CTI12_AA465370 [Artemisia annua]|uniref:Protein kinase domain-containing protein n=1 Tax=Artemisia annua TaxID=35608 RepID=A0A2U1LIX7_ARTAN|nr:hypothetical protein CTI12_AA465370 [Artemisia annua]